MAFALVGSVAFLASGLTLYSGFGLGTLLMPVFALFYPVEVAVAATAVVHGANNVVKITAFGKHADRSLVLKFGVPAMVAALIGASALGYMSYFSEIATYSVGPWTATVTPVKLSMGALIFLFGLFELLPRLRDLRFNRRQLVLGGMLSGFFGGLSGHQGALRSAFLVKVDMPTEAFVGTNAVIGFMVDTVRIATYAAVFLLMKTTSPIGPDQWPLIATGILSAGAGVLAGKRFLHQVTMKAIQKLTGILLLGVALALSAGWL